MITEGRVNITRMKEGEEVTVTQLDAGNYFGEVALIEDKPRNANVTAIEETTCYVLERAEFRSVIDASDSFESELRKVLFERN